VQGCLNPNKNQKIYHALSQINEWFIEPSVNGPDFLNCPGTTRKKRSNLSPGTSDSLDLSFSLPFSSPGCFWKNEIDVCPKPECHDRSSPLLIGMNPTQQSPLPNQVCMVVAPPSPVFFRLLRSVPPPASLFILTSHLTLSERSHVSFPLSSLFSNQIAIWFFVVVFLCLFWGSLVGGAAFVWNWFKIFDFSKIMFFVLASRHWDKSVLMYFWFMLLWIHTVVHHRVLLPASARSNARNGNVMLHRWRKHPPLPCSAFLHLTFCFKHFKHVISCDGVLWSPMHSVLLLIQVIPKITLYLRAVSVSSFTIFFVFLFFLDATNLSRAPLSMDGGGKSPT
jgi:hypothetical protein